MDVNQALKAIRGKSAVGRIAQALVQNTSSFVHGMASDLPAQEQALTSVLEKVPLEYNATFGLGAASIRRHEWLDAINHFTNCLITRPSDAASALNRAVARLGYASGGGAKREDVIREMLHEAIQDLDLAQNGASHDASIYYNRGVAKHKLGMHDSAEADLTMALKLSPDDPHTLLVRMQVHVTLRA